MSAHRAVCTLLAQALTLAACGGGGEAAGSQTSDAFVAFAGDLSGYRAWPSFPVDGDAAIAAGVHAAGRRIEYVNRLPPHSATAFPVGTVVVKEVHADVESDSRTFAMVKRGGGFNAAGASGWEWFELQRDTDPVVITWRGVGPPLGEKYGGDAQGGCNGCHGGARDNDSVLSRALKLGNF